MTIPRALSAVLLAAQLGGQSLAVQNGKPTRADCLSCAGMTWVDTSCNGFYATWYDSLQLPHLDQLPAGVRKALARHLSARLGEYAAKLTFDRAFYVDVDGYFTRHPGEQRKPDWPYSYDVHFKLRLSEDGPVDYCAQIGLDQNGKVLHEINLPDLSRSPEKGVVLGASRLLALAEALGVPVENARLDLKYDEKSDVLEYRVECDIKAKDDDANLGILFVTAHDPSRYRWFRTKQLASDQGSARRNYCMQRTAGRLAGVTSEVALAGRR